MIVTVDNSVNTPINWGADGKEAIIQNVFTLLQTYRYEIAYDRTLGLQRDFVDMPEAEAVSLATAGIYELIENGEPRATIISVDYNGISLDGNMMFQVVIDV